MAKCTVKEFLIKVFRSAFKYRTLTLRQVLFNAVKELYFCS